jgi:filamentous hemagglutinin family protein
MIKGIILTTLLCFKVHAAGPAGVKLDGSIGAAAQVLAGPTYNITQNLGKLAGGNLFFSFQYFNIATGQTALYTTTSPGINNVISRVTGGDASTIDGTISLQAAYGAPNFFLINPAGVTFTANAQVNVPASFHVTTADYLKFGDGNFYSDPTKPSTLSAAAPEAFGFLGATRSPVNVLGATLSGGNNGMGDFQIVAGDVTIDGGGGVTLNGVLEPAGISNTGGNIGVTAVGNATAEVPLSGSFTSTDGTVTIRNGGALVTQSGAQSAGGSIEVNAGTLLVDGASLPFNGYFQTGVTTSTNAAGLGTGGAGAVTVNVGDGATLINGGAIGSESLGAGAAGNVSVSARNLAIDGGNLSVFTGVFDQAGSSGSAGNITLNAADAVSIANAGEISSATYGSADAGLMTLRMGSLSIDGADSKYITGIFGIAAPGSTGSAGIVSVNASGGVSLADGGAIATDSYSVGNAGQINLHAGSLSIDGGQQTSGYPGLDGLGTGVFSRGLTLLSGAGGQIDITVDGGTTVTNNGAISAGTAGIGQNAGNIDMSSGTLTMAGGYVTTNTSLFFGSAGEIDINVPGAVSLSDLSAIVDAGTQSLGISLHAGSLSMTGFSTIDVSDVAFTTAPPIVVDVVGSASIADGSELFSFNFPGNAGSISFTANNLTINGKGAPFMTGISNSTYGAGNGGNTYVHVGTLTIDGGNNPYETGISSGASVDPYTTLNTVDTGSGGNIVVEVTGAAQILNGGSISSATQTYGNAGSVKFSAASLSITGSSGSVNDTVISSDSTSGSTGNAGNVDVTVGSLRIDGGGSPNFVGIVSRSLPNSQGSAGNVTVDVSGDAILQDGGRISTTSAATVSDPGSIAAGKIAVVAQQLELNDGQITAASTGNVAAGSIDISFTSALRMDDGTIATSSTQGNGGPIQITGLGIVWLDQSGVTTSVLGKTNGNGGDIRITVPYIVLESGVIQANTTAPKAAGGDVVISAQALIPSFDSYTLGGRLVSVNSATLGQNVVQAAAPDGVSGTLDVTVPSLDLGSALLGLTGTPSTPIALSRSLCTYRQGSSLSTAGRGGLPVSYRDPLWVDLGEAPSGAAVGASRAARNSAPDLPLPLQRFPSVACR